MNAKTLMDSRPMTALQISTVLVCWIMNMLDGMDVLIISYAAPAIASDWNIKPAALGLVYSSGLVGMTLGTLFLTPFADRIGRKAIILISGAIMGIFLYLTSIAGNITELMIYRFISGLGIGSMLASTAAIASEFAPAKTRDFWVSFAISGYPVGAVLSGLAAAVVIPAEGWQQMFKYAGIASALSVPIVFLFLSESVDYYARIQPKGALEKLNKILGKMHIEPLHELPPTEKVKNQIPVEELLSPEFRKSTIQLWIALFMAFAALYFLTSWIPKMAKDAGLSLKLAIYAGTVFNVGAFFGIITQGYFSSNFGLSKTIGVFLFTTGVLMASFGLFLGSDWLLLVFAFLGFGIQGGFVGLYAMAAKMYPAQFRTTGVGWAMGAGRIGGFVGPSLAGLFIQAGVSISVNFIIFAIPALVGGYITYKIYNKEIA